MSNIFDCARANDWEGLEFLVKQECCVDDRDDMGRTALHICATHGCEETTQKLINMKAQMNILEYESGWSPLHTAVYHGHLKVSLILIRAGCDIGDDWKSSDWKTNVFPKKEFNRSIRNASSWRSPIDHDGHSPLDLLSFRLAPYLAQSKILLEATHVQVFGKSDFQLGIPLPKSAEVVRPRRIEPLMNLRVKQLAASKYHTLAVTYDGVLYSWGHGRGGRLGQGDEITRPEPCSVSFAHFSTLSLRDPANVVRIKTVSAGENHTLALTLSGDVFSWGSDRFGQLGHGSGPSEKEPIPNVTQASLYNGLTVNASGRGSTNTVSNRRCSLFPKHVDSLRKHKIVGVAAGATHSLCFSDCDEIFAWGSNKHGQLGIRVSDCVSLSGGNGPGLYTPKKINSKDFNSKSSKFSVIQVAASSFNSLLLVTTTTARHGPTNQTNNRNITEEVYQWGHGSSTPSKVQFNYHKRPVREFDGGPVSGIRVCNQLSITDVSCVNLHVNA